MQSSVLLASQWHDPDSSDVGEEEAGLGEGLLPQRHAVGYEVAYRRKRLGLPR